MKKRIFNLIMILILLISLVGCDDKKKNDEKTLNKIGDYIYEITFKDDLDWSKAVDPDLSDYACSGVQNGQYRGRNYDWVYSENGICVVHVAANENRLHASVGVADLSFVSDINDLDSIPFMVVDGINDAGVCIQANVMPGYEYDKPDHTKTKDDDLPSVAVVRYVLDYADSIEDAINLLKNKDIYSQITEESDIHWMISGPTSKTDETIKTIVIEVMEDGLNVIENFVDNKPIMTNFNISNFDGSEESIGYGSGYERWQILNEYYDQANSIMGTFDLMEKVYYSKLYDLYGDRFWYSEFNGTDLTHLYETDELKALIGDDVYDYYMDNYGGVYYNPALYDGEEKLNGDIDKAGIIKAGVEYTKYYYESQNKEDEILWISVHTSVYDLVNKTLDIQVRESQDCLHFTIE